MVHVHVPCHVLLHWGDKLLTDSTSAVEWCKSEWCKSRAHTLFLSGVIPIFMCQLTELFKFLCANSHSYFYVPTHAVIQIFMCQLTVNEVQYMYSVHVWPEHASAMGTHAFQHNTRTQYNTDTVDFCVGLPGMCMCWCMCVCVCVTK